GRHHDPDRPWRGKRRHQRLERGGALCAHTFSAADCLGTAVERDNLMPAAGEPRHHVQAHPTETNESKLHDTHQKCNHEDHEDTKITKKTPGMYLRVCFVVSCHSDAFLALFQ